MQQVKPKIEGSINWHEIQYIIVIETEVYSLQCIKVNAHNKKIILVLKKSTKTSIVTTSKRHLVHKW